MNINLLILLLFSVLFFLSACQQVMLQHKEKSAVSPPDTNFLANKSEQTKKANDLSKKDKQASISKELVSQLSGEFLRDYLTAELAMDSGDFPRAYSIYADLAQKYEDSRVVKRMVLAAMSSLNDELILSAMDIWEQSEPDNLRLHQIRSVILLKLSQDNNAIVSLLRYIELFNQQQAKENISADLKKNQGILKLAALLANIKNWDRINSILSAIEKIYPENLDLLKVWAEFAQQFEQFSLAEEKLNAALQIQPKETELLLLKLKRQQATLSAAEIIQAFDSATKRSDNPQAVFLAYAKYLIEQKKNKLAKEQLVKAVQPAIFNKSLLQEVALTAITIEEYEFADQLLQRIYQHKPYQNEAAFLLANMWLNQQQNERALQWFDKVKTGRFFYRALMTKTLLLSDLKQYQRAIKELQYFEPENTEQQEGALFIQAGILVKMQQYDKAYELLSRLLTMSRRTIDILYERAMLSEKMGNLNLMEQDLSEILTIDPNNADALNTLGYVLANNNMRLEQAYDYIRRALKAKPDNVAFLDSMGWVLYRLGKLEKSLTYLKKAYEIEQDPEIVAHYGEVLWHSNQIELAKSVWYKALQSNPSHDLLKATYQQFVGQ